MNLPRPTALGVKFLLFWLLLVAAFLATPYSNLFFLLLTYLTLLGALSFLWTARAGRGGITWHLRSIPPTAAGLGAGLQSDASAALRSPHLRVIFRVILKGPGDGPGDAGPRAVALGRLPALGRGIYKIERATIESVWPTGLFRAALPLRAQAEFVVYPQPASLRESGSAEGLLADLAGDREGGMQPSGLHEFREGDDPRRIHWKASARRGGFVVKEWAGAEARGREVQLDRRRGAAALEEALSLLAALVLEAREAKEPLTLHTQGLVATFGDHHRPWEECLRFLAAADCLPPAAPPPPPTSPGTPRL